MKIFIHSQSFTQKFTFENVDVMIASLTLDHLETIENLEQVFASLYGALSIGGTCTINSRES